ncbi:GNAT family N-acetyltransferase [Cellulomonas soli]|uniref:GNAT family N-acetyltransferase n=1 Tax=Cellulomonas soli TaxID=931535 RepID=UPI003F834C89
MPKTLIDVSWPVRTERLLIRPATAADAPAVWRYRRLPEVTEWMTSRPADEPAFVATYLEPDRLARTLLVERAGQVVGDLMVRVEDAWAQTEAVDGARGVQAEIGWSFDPAWHGQGLATEASRRLLALCFDELGLRRVLANCFADNEPSWRLMERLGMRREGAFVAESLHRSGRWLDGYTYAMLRHEWVPGV